MKWTKKKNESERKIKQQWIEWKMDGKFVWILKIEKEIWMESFWKNEFKFWETAKEREL